jgi:hypothetical protein
MREDRRPEFDMVAQLDLEARELLRRLTEDYARARQERDQALDGYDQAERTWRHNPTRANCRKMDRAWEVLDWHLNRCLDFAELLAGETPRRRRAPKVGGLETDDERAVAHRP